MKIQNLFLVIAAIIFIAAPAPKTVSGADQIHGMRYPELSPDGSTLVFSYQGDLWSVNAKGGVASRLTTHQAYEGRSRFSPDGKFIAFESTRFGNLDIFTMPATGSNSPKQVTTGSNFHMIGAWFPDGKSLITILAGPMSAYNMCRKDLGDGMNIPLFEDLHDHYNPNFAKDGKTIYYLRSCGGVDWWRTGYHGSADNDIWSYNLDTKEHRQIYADDRSQQNLRIAPDDKSLYFVDYVIQGSSNVARLDLATKKITYLTDYKDDTVRNLTIDGNGLIVYEYMNDLWRIDPGKSPVMLAIEASAEDKDNFVEYQTFSAEIQNADVSRDGKLVALMIKGDVFAFRTDGEVDNKGVTLTETSEKTESEPAFSLDGKSMFYFVDEGYGNRIVKMDLKTKATEEMVSEPDGMHYLLRIPTTDLLSYIKGTGDIMVFDPATKKSDRIARKLCYSCGGASIMNWSPDGHYLALVDSSEWDGEIFVVDRETKDIHDVSYTRESEDNPYFSPDGKWLAYSQNIEMENRIMLVELDPKAKVDETVLVPEEEKPADKEGEETKPSEEPSKPTGDGKIVMGGMPPMPPMPPSASPKGDEKKEEGEKKKPEKVEVKINFDRIDERPRVVSIHPGWNIPLGFSSDSKWLFYARQANPHTPIRELWAVPVDEKSKEQPKNLGSAPDALLYTDDQMYALMGGMIQKFDPSAGVTEPLQFSVNRTHDKLSEQLLVCLTAGQSLKEGFYDKNMHGADWDRVRKKYFGMMKDARTPEDVTALLNRLNGELNASHLYAYGPSSFTGQADETAGLGIDWDLKYEGPGLKIRRILKNGAADHKELELKTDDIVLKIDGHDIEIHHDPAPFLNHQVDKVVRLTVKGEKENREVKIRTDNPYKDNSTRYETWVKENRERVDKLSKGKIGYLHIQWMGFGSLRKFEKEYLNMTREKKGIIIDVRFNPGGNIHEQLIDILDRHPFGYGTLRGWEAYIPQPAYYNRTPSVCLINESSYSDAEIFPYAYHELKLGKLIGMPTFGAVIGTNNIDIPGGYAIRIPCEGWFGTDLVNLENKGVKPDIEVPWPPDAYSKDSDPQIERAVEELLKQTK